MQHENELPGQWRSLIPHVPDPHALQPAEMGQVNRREFLSLMAASLALAGVEGCSPAATLPEKIVPYVRPPEDMLPGKPLHFATAMPLGGYGIGLIVKSDDGRPVKVEGNPKHPASLGATDVFAQASVLSLYDPDRAKTVTRRGVISTADTFTSMLSDELERFKGTGGTGLRFLSGKLTSLSQAALRDRILRTFPNAVWHYYEPINDDNRRIGQRIAFGRYVDTTYNFKNADVIVSIDADFLTWGPARLRSIREFADRRVPAAGQSVMNRLYVFESTPTTTGAKADHRIPMRPFEIASLVVSIASRLGIEGVPEMKAGDYWFDPMMRDLQSHAGSTLFIAGEGQPPYIHALVHAINEKLGNNGNTVDYREPVESGAFEQTSSLLDLVNAMKDGQVDTLVMLDVNPVYSAPADMEFSSSLSKVRLRISHSAYYDETAAECDWHVPKHHYLESWDDVRAYDGTVSLIQPLIIPLYETRSLHQLLSIFLDDPARSNYELVRNFWLTQHQGDNFEEFWQQSLQDGFINGDQFTSRPANVKVRSLSGFSTSQETSGTEELDILFRPDPAMYDGSFANNGWLQELPDPLTKLTWDNAVLIGPKTATKLKISNDDTVDVIVDGRQVTGSVWVAPGQAENTVTVRLGWGRSIAGRSGSGRGFNAYLLRTTSHPWQATGLIKKRNEKERLVSTQNHSSTEGRPIVRHMTETEYSAAPGFIQHETRVPGPQETLYPGFQSIGYAWGMSVDMSRCVGCNACIVACQAENNSPIVGKEEVARGREMQWLRIDRYYEGPPDAPDTYFQPMFCQHCENAPCEYVCPVEATTHSSEGLNEMTYNRCIGTRYCSNNCPYKVRRFNFFQYTVWDIPSLQMLYNPDVTVRSRGVMEKCTYCVQRINRSRIEAMKEDRKIRDGELVTACQQACPAQVFVFGNLLDKDSNVSQLKSQPRNYSVLAEYNTQPRTTYLAILKNPNPEITGFEAGRNNGG